MTLDLTLLCIILVVALFGALAGAARQIANLIGMVLAYLGARPIGDFAGPHLARIFKTSESVAIVAGTVLAFVLIWVLCRIVFTKILQRFFAGEDPDSRSNDRILGFILAGVKVTAVVWIFLCAFAFVEENVTFAGRKLGVSPKDSKAFALAKRFNLFELTQFAPVKDLTVVVAAAADPEQAQHLKNDPAYQRLAKDPRFQRALNDRSLQAAFARGDYRALLKNNAILQLIQDPKTAEQLKSLAKKSE